MNNSGEKPGKGTYMCHRCSTAVKVERDGDELPNCPRCNGTEFVKLNT